MSYTQRELRQKLAALEATLQQTDAVREQIMSQMIHLQMESDRRCDNICKLYVVRQASDPATYSLTLNDGDTTIVHQNDLIARVSDLLREQYGIPAK